MSNEEEGHLFVEQRDDGQFALQRGGSEKAIGLFETQKEAIDRGKAMGEKVVAERVRQTKVNGPDKWRKT